MTLTMDYKGEHIMHIISDTTNPERLSQLVIDSRTELVKRYERNKRIQEYKSSNPDDYITSTGNLRYMCLEFKEIMRTSINLRRYPLVRQDEWYLGGKTLDNLHTQRVDDIGKFVCDILGCGNPITTKEFKHVLVEKLTDMGHILLFKEEYDDTERVNAIYKNRIEKLVDVIVNCVGASELCE